MSELCLHMNRECRLSCEDYKVGDCIFGYKIENMKKHKICKDSIVSVQLKKTENVDSLHMLIFAIIADAYWELSPRSNIELIEEVLKDCDKKYLQIIYVCAIDHYSYSNNYCVYKNNIIALLKNAGVVEMSQEDEKQFLEDLYTVNKDIDNRWHNGCGVCKKKHTDKIDLAHCFLSHQPLFWSELSDVKFYKMLIENNPYYQLIARKKKSSLRRLKRDLKEACDNLNYDNVAYILSIIRNTERARIKECELKYKITNFELNIATIKEFTQYSEIMQYFIKDVGTIIISYVLNPFLSNENKEKCIKLAEESWWHDNEFIDISIVIDKENKIINIIKSA